MKPKPATPDTPPAREAAVVAALSFEGVDKIAGVTWDGHHVWFADGTRGGLCAVDPQNGAVVRRLPHVPAGAGTAFDGTFLYQIAGAQIQKIDPATGEIVGTLPTPGAGCSGLGWAEGALWVGQHRARRVVKIDAQTGAVLKTVASDRFVTGVTWVDGELWHGTWEGGTSDVRRVDPDNGEVIDCIELPAGSSCSGVGADDQGRLWCGDGATGKLRAVRRRR